MAAFSRVDERIVECVDSGLGALGESVKHVIYYYVEENFQLEKNEIPEKPQVFKQAITSMFGEEGAKIIEQLIVQKMRNAFKVRRRLKQTFTDIVVEVKTRA